MPMRWVSSTRSARHRALQLLQLVVTHAVNRISSGRTARRSRPRMRSLGYHLAQLPEAEGRWRIRQSAPRSSSPSMSARCWEGIPGYLSGAYPGVPLPLQPAHRCRGRRWTRLVMTALHRRQAPSASWRGSRAARSGSSPTATTAAQHRLLEEIAVRFPVTTPDPWHRAGG